MTEEELDRKRRMEDTPFGMIVYFWPALIGVAAILVSLGGYIATLHYIGVHIDQIEHWISAQDRAAEERNTIMARLTTLQDVTNRRLDALEDWQSSQVFPPSFRRRK